MYALGVFHQIVQQAKFSGAEFEFLPRIADAVRPRIKLQLAHANAVAHLLGGAAAQHGTHTRQQLLRRKGFGDVVISARIQALDFVRFVATGGKHQDGNGLAARVAAPLFGQLHTAGARQHPVEQNHIGQHGVDFALRGFAALYPNGVKTVVAQIDGNQLGNRRFVFHYQYTGFTHRWGILDFIAAPIQFRPRWCGAHLCPPPDR